MDLIKINMLDVTNIDASNLSLESLTKATPTQFYLYRTEWSDFGQTFFRKGVYSNISIISSHESSSISNVFSTRTLFCLT